MFKKLYSYAAWLYVLTMLSSAVSFIVTIYMAKVISIADMGIYAFYVAVYTMCGSFITSGVDRTFVKFLGGEEREYESLISLYLLVTFLSMAVFFISGFFLLPFFEYEIWLGVMAVGPFVGVQLGAVVFRGRLEKKCEIILLVSVSLLNSIVTFLLLSIEETAKSPIAADFASMFLPSFVMIFIFFNRLGGVTRFMEFLKNERQLIRDFVAFAKPLWFAGIAFAGRSQLNNFFIKYLLGYQSLGVFFFARRLLGLATKPVDILTKVLLAGFSIKKNVDLNNYRIVLALNMLVFPAVCILVVNSLPMGIEILGLDQYKNASMYVALLSLALPLSCSQAIMGIANVVLNVPVVSQRSYVFSSVISIPVSALLIYYFGVIGACSAPVFFSFLLFFFNVKFLHPVSAEHSILALKIGVGSEVLYIFTLALGYYLDTAFVAIPLVLLYWLLGHVLKIWDLRELCSIFFKNFLSRRSGVAS